MLKSFKVQLKVITVKCYSSWMTRVHLHGQWTCACYSCCALNSAASVCVISFLGRIKKDDWTELEKISQHCEEVGHQLYERCG